MYAIALPLCYTPLLTLGDGRAKIGLPRPRPDVEDAPDPELSVTIMKADGSFLHSSFDQKSVQEDIKSVPADFEVCHFPDFLEFRSKSSRTKNPLVHTFLSAFEKRIYSHRF